MDPLTVAGIIGILLIGVFGFIGWLIRDRFKKLEEVDTRLVKVETKLDVLGDINNTLNTLRTDIELIKQKLEAK